MSLSDWWGRLLRPVPLLRPHRTGLVIEAGAVAYERPEAFDGLLGERTAPPSVIEQLREIDPAADLAYWGEGEWLLGVWGRSNNQRCMDISVLLNNAVRWPPSLKRDRTIQLRLAQLRGFRLVRSEPYFAAGDFGHIVHDFALRTYNYINRFRDALKEAIEYNDYDRDVEQRAALMEEYVDAEGKSDHKILLGGRVSTRVGVDIKGMDP